MLSVTSPLFYTSAVNGPPRGDAANIGAGFRVAVVYSVPEPQLPPAEKRVVDEAAAAAAATVVTPETVALALKSVGNTRPPLTLT